jgi:hypothetical protein
MKIYLLVHRLAQVRAPKSLVAPVEDSAEGDLSVTVKMSAELNVRRGAPLSAPKRRFSNILRVLNVSLK